jgi:hypothetical protein
VLYANCLLNADEASSKLPNGLLVSELSFFPVAMYSTLPVHSEYQVMGAQCKQAQQCMPFIINPQREYENKY